MAPQPLSPHSLPLHCGEHTHVPFMHAPALPAEVVQPVPFVWFCATHLFCVHTPTLHSLLSAEQSPFAAHCTHWPSPTHCGVADGHALAV